jgi:hypothetical protein
MKHLIPFLVLIILNFPAWADETSEFLIQNSKGLNPQTRDEGRRKWDKLLELYKKTGNPELIKIALLTKPNAQLQSVERAIVFYDLLMLKPSEFIQAAKTFDPQLTCFFEILIPRTQFIPFGDIKTKVAGISPVTTAVEDWKKRSGEYFKRISEGKPTDDLPKCKL